MSASNLPMVLGETVYIYKTRFGIANSIIYETVALYKVGVGRFCALLSISVEGCQIELPVAPATLARLKVKS
jgi:hypothetical protein